MHKTFLIIACISGAVGVILGAFAAHALKSKLPENIFNAFEVGVRYQFYHTFALIAVALMRDKISDAQGLLHYSGWGFIIGIILFSGSLYFYSLTQQKFFVWLTPIGGLTFILSWLVLLAVVLKIKS